MHGEAMGAPMSLGRQRADSVAAAARRGSCPETTPEHDTTRRVEQKELLPSPGGSDSESSSHCTAQIAAHDRRVLMERVLAAAPVSVWAIDPDGKFMLGQGNNQELMGLNLQEVVGRSIFELLGDLPQVVEVVRLAMAGESAAATAEVDGVAVAVSCEPLLDADGAVLGAGCIAVDVTEQQQAKLELSIERRRMREMLLAHERDRRLIAYEIHDGPVQDMAGAQMYMESLLRDNRLPAGPIREELSAATGLLRKAIDESRRVINGLRPPILDDLGIVPAVEYLTADQPEGGPPIALSVEGEFCWLDPLVEGTVYRIVQEAVSNARRHSRSERVEVRLSKMSERICVEVRDWGVGFDPADIEDKRLGLKGIRERARLLGGRAAIESSPGEGTRVVVELPTAAVPN
jgi:PAS domain S-box-containing protein